VTDPLHPSEGIRLLLERTEVEPDDAAAAYRGAIYTHDAVYAYRARLAMDGGVELAAEGTPAPRALEDKLRVHARTVARAAAQKQGGGLPPWPHRVLRWRPVRPGAAEPDDV
jgi:hypothetical protein